MAEGDTIHRLARRLADAFAGSEVTATSPGPRRPAGMAPSFLDGRVLESVEPRGKHLLLHFSGGATLHSHLGMRGSWHLYRTGEPWRRPARRAWIAITSPGHVAVNFDGSTLRLVRDVELPRDRRLARLGPDILSPGFDSADAASRIAAAGELQLGEALLDQTLVAGIGNIFKSEGCFAAGLDPWQRVADLDRGELAGVIAATRVSMSEAVAGGSRPGAVYRRAGRPCPRCGTTIRSRPQGDDARLTYSCPGCQGDGPGRAGPVADGGVASGAERR